MNKVLIMGRLTANPELKYSQNNAVFCKFSVAVKRNYKNNSGEYETDFISCTAWGKTAEFLSKYFQKGQMIALEGSLRTGSYKDRKFPEITHYTTDLFVESVEFTGSKSTSQSQPQYEDIVMDEPF